MHGFTLIELLLVIAIFLVVGVVVTPLYGNLSVATQLNEEASQLVQTIRLARERAVSGFHSSRHGVCFESAAGGGRYILYQGADCATRLASADRVTDLPPALTWSTTLPLPDINFDAVGAPSNIGVITLTHAAYGTRTITINELGLVEE
ncbi:MAG: GspH/FimT family pseudopilin [Candidatus Vogelbacteria bacterium]|nr:GspH/FimT family pseudopilin [Candidatus Vogelbacteria bacterium]